MKRRLFTLVLLVLVSLTLPLTVYADAGPKPSVQVTFSPVPNQVCYGT